MAVGAKVRAKPVRSGTNSFFPSRLQGLPRPKPALQRNVAEASLRFDSPHGFRSKSPWEEQLVAADRDSAARRARDTTVVAREGKLVQVAGLVITPVASMMCRSPPGGWSWQCL